MAPSHFSELHVSEDSQSRDRLSELPDFLILEILSLLETRDVVATTLLSKRWVNLWATLPCLNFDFLQPTFDNKLDKFRNFVCGALALWRGSKIIKFSLSFDMDNCFVTSDVVDSWLLFAIEKQVEELYINLIRHRAAQQPSVYYAPSRLYLCSSIRKLSLDNCELTDEDFNVQWDQLVSLTINFAETLSENVVNQVLSGAPKLEVLNLPMMMQTIHNLNIDSTSLKNVSIERWRGYLGSAEIGNAMLRIRAPNLEMLKISGVPYARCLLNVPSTIDLVLGLGVDSDNEDEAVEEEGLRQFLLSIRHVENVTILTSCFEAIYAMKKKDMVMPLSNAKFLELWPFAAHKILDVLEMFPQLMTLFITHQTLMLKGNIGVRNMLEPQTDFQCSLLLHLRRVVVKWLVPDGSIYPVMQTLLKNARMLEKMVFCPLSLEVLQSQMKPRLLEKVVFPTVSHRVQNQNL